MNSNKQMFCILLLFFFQNLSVAQTILSGTVKDNSTMNPVLGVHIRTDRFGTITDSLGRFSIKARKDDSKITFSHIGYKQIVIFIDSLDDYNNINIQMESSAFLLNEIDISSIQSEILLIQNVIENIPINYSVNCFSQKVLIRESLSKKQVPLTVIEAQALDKVSNIKGTNIQKETYIQSIRTHSSKSSKKYPKLRIAGATAILEKINPLLNEQGVFNPKAYIKDYSFEIKDTLKIDSVQYVKLAFSKIKSNWSAEMIINLEDFSVINYTASKKNKSLLDIKSYNIDFIKISIKYNKKDTFYYTKSLIVEQTYSPIKQDTLISRAEYFVLDIFDCKADLTGFRTYDNDIFSEITESVNNPFSNKEIIPYDKYNNFFTKHQQNKVNPTLKPKIYYVSSWT